MSDRLWLPGSHAPAGTGSTRRRFLAGMAVTGLVAACGGNDDGAAPPSTDSSGGAGGDLPEGIVGGLSAARFYGPYYLAGQAARVPLGLTDDEGFVPTELAPAELGISVRGPDATLVAEGITAPRYGAGLPRSYYAFEFTPEAPGFYDILIEPGFGGEVITQVQIVDADDPIASAIVGPGDAMPPLETPTVDDARGVTPLCTREPACDLHAMTLAQALEVDGPTVLLVATPAFCQTIVCGPVLDVLIDVLGDFPGVTAVHAEVYADPTQNSVPPVPEDFAPTVGALGLAYEPVLYTVAADGTVVDRLDYVFAAEEMTAALERLTSG